MKAQITWRHFVNVILLTAVLFFLSVVDFINFTVSVARPGMLLLVCVLQVLVMSLVTIRAQQRRWPLMLALFLTFYGVNSVMVAIEAVYLPETLTADIVLAILVNGGIRALVYTAISVQVWHHGTNEVRQMEARAAAPAWRWFTWIGKFVLIGLCWGILFTIGGALVFLPLAGHLDSEALASYINLDMPAWVLPFQLVRGMVWAGVTLPLIRFLRGSRWTKALSIGLMFAVIMGSNLLLADSLPQGIRIAHLVEVCLENILFGILVTMILTPRQRPSARRKVEAHA